MALTFDAIKTRLESLVESYKQELGGAFKITTTPHKKIELQKDLPLKNVENFLRELFGADTDFPEIPMGGAVIKALLISPANDEDVFTAKLKMGFTSAEWHVMDGLVLSLNVLSFENKGGAWSGHVGARALAQERTFDVSLDWPEMIVQGHLVNPSVQAANAAMQHAAQLPFVEVPKTAADKAMNAKASSAMAAASAALGTAVDAGYTKDDTKGLLEKHALQVPATARLDRLEIYAAPRIHYVNFIASGSDLIQFHDLILKSVDLALTYAGGASSTFTGSIDTVFVIGTAEFQLNVARTQTGWTGKATATASISVDDMVKNVSNAVFNVSHKASDFGVPDDLAKKPITGRVTLTLDSAKKAVSLEIDATLDNGEATFLFAISKGGVTAKGKLKLGDLEFELDFSNASGQPVMAAQFNSEKGVTLKFEDLVKLSQLTGTATSKPVDANLSVTLRDILLGATKSGGKTHYLLAADLDGGIDLSGLGDLPLVGSLMPADMAFGLSLAPILPHGTWSAGDVKALNTLRGKSGPSLIEKKIDEATLGMSFKSPGHAPVALDLPLESNPAQADEIVKPKAGTDETIHWKDVQRKFGPVTLNRVGVGLDRKSTTGPVVQVALDGALEIAGLELSLIGLGGHYNLKSKKLGFDLKGLGMSLERGQLKIAGAFANMGNEYLGKATLGMKSFTLSAMGGFAMIKGKPGDKHDTPSMFVYGILNVPIGGPAFFFVEGLAAGFGYNRKFTGPPVSGVKDFPFVKDAIGAAGGSTRKGPSDGGGIAKELEELHKYITPQMGQYFAAVGVKFTSFKLLDSFVLLVVSFGRDVEIDVLGVSTYQMPPIVPVGTPALAWIVLNLDTSFRPKTGLLKVNAELARDSYVYSSLCHLSGGFAFYSWFGPENAGDFVLSAGGYSTKFDRPAHYPKVSRISLTYQITSNIYVKGSAYFALTPSMFMAGGSLSASAKFGKVSASFTMGVDFEISWEPYHYMAEAHLDIRASWWIFDTHASASLSVWGPTFSGYARVHWSVVSFDVSFVNSMPYAPAVDFTKFCQSFLPHDSGSKAPNIVPTLAVAAGQVAERPHPAPSVGTNDTVPVINPKTLEIRVDATIPAATVNGSAVGTATLGCAPMGASSLKNADLQYWVKDSNGNPATSHFDIQPFFKGVPKAMWGQKLKPNVKDKGHMIEACGGITLRAAIPPKMPKAQTITRDECKYDILPDRAFATHLSAASPTPTVIENNTLGIADALVPKDGCHRTAQPERGSCPAWPGH